MSADAVRSLVGWAMVIVGLILTTPVAESKSEKMPNIHRKKFSSTGLCCCDGGPEHNHFLTITCAEHRANMEKFYRDNPQVTP